MIYLFCKCGLILSSVFQWIFILYYHLFWCSNCPRFVQWEHLEAGLCLLKVTPVILLACPYFLGQDIQGVYSFLEMFLVLNSTLLREWIVRLVHICLMFKWFILSHGFAFDFPVYLYLKCISYKQQIIGLKNKLTFIIFVIYMECLDHLQLT